MLADATSGGTQLEERSLNSEDVEGASQQWTGSYCKRALKRALAAAIVFVGILVAVTFVSLVFVRTAAHTHTSARVAVPPLQRSAFRTIGVNSKAVQAGNPFVEFRSGVVPSLRSDEKWISSRKLPNYPNPLRSADTSFDELAINVKPAWERARNAVVPAVVPGGKRVEHTDDSSTVWSAPIDGILSGFDCALLLACGTSDTSLYFVQREDFRAGGVAIEEIGSVQGGILKQMRTIKLKGRNARFKGMTTTQFYGAIRDLLDLGATRISPGKRIPLHVLATESIRSVSFKEQNDLASDLMEAAAGLSDPVLGSSNVKFSTVTSEEKARFEWLGTNAASVRSGVEPTLPTIDIGSEFARLAASSIGGTIPDMTISTKLGMGRFKSDCWKEIHDHCKVSSHGSPPWRCLEFARSLIAGDTVCESEYKGVYRTINKWVVKYAQGSSEESGLHWLSRKDRDVLQRFEEFDMSSFSRVVTLGNLAGIQRFLRWSVQNFADESLKKLFPTDGIDPVSGALQTTNPGGMTLEQFQSLTLFVCGIPSEQLLERWQATGTHNMEREAATGRYTVRQADLACSDASFASAVLEAFKLPPATVLQSQEPRDPWVKGVFMAMTRTATELATAKSAASSETNGLAQPQPEPQVQVQTKAVPQARSRPLPQKPGIRTAPEYATIR